LLLHTKILSSEYESESETSTGSALSLYTSSQPTLPLPSLSLSSTTPLSFYEMSQFGYPAIIGQRQEQIAALIVQVEGGEAEGTIASMEVARP